MTDTSLPHRRIHNLLLIQKLLTLRDGASPFTLILDSVEQSAKPLVRHYVLNAQLSKTSTVFISYETLSPPPGVTHAVKARRKNHEAVQKEVLEFCSQSKKTLIIIDTLHPICTTPTVHLPAFLSSLLSTPHTTLLAIYHTDIPLPLPLHIPASVSHNPYAPSPLTLLKYLVTTIFTVHSFSHVLARKRAKDKSLPEPVFGLDEEKEGVVAGMGGNGDGGLVLEMEYRRKSGRGVLEQFYFPTATTDPKGRIILLDDHPSFRREVSPPEERERGPEASGATFELGITEAQRKVREGVVLPYFDAQKGVGVGGRILYEMGAEDMDDFDEEEDEI